MNMQQTKVIFDPIKHQYFVDDINYPSVTQIIGVLDKSAPLINWSLRIAMDYLSRNFDTLKNSINSENAGKIFYEAKKEYMKIKDEAADIGTQIHDIIHRINNNESVDLTKYDERVQNGVNAYLKWANSVNYSPIKSEFIIYSKKFKFAGTCDGLGFINGKLAILDWKSSNAIYDEYKLQIAAYDAALKEMGTEQPVEDHYIIRFSKDTGDFEVCKVEDIAKHFEAFKAAIQLYAWKKSMQKNGRSCVEKSLIK